MIGLDGEITRPLVKSDDEPLIVEINGESVENS